MAVNLGSNFSNFINGVTIRGVPVTQLHPGKVFWVNSSAVYAAGQAVAGNNTVNSGTYTKPFATIAYAVTRCLAGRGDIIAVMPGHAESITAAAGIALNVSGVCIIGTGAGTLRPTITFTTANTATMTVTAANCSILNVKFVPNFLSIARAIGVTATDFTVQNCDFSDTSSILNFLNIINCTGAANTADRLSFIDNKVVNLGVTSNNTTILTANDIDGLEIKHNYMKWAVQNDKAIACIVTAGVLTNLQCDDNVGYRPNTTTAGGSLITVGGTTSTGFVRRNYVQTLTTTTDLLFTTTVGLAAFENRVSGVVGATGFVIPAVDS